jgi:hypothetical protein
VRGAGPPGRPVIEPSTLLLRSERAVAEATPDGHLVLDLATGEYFDMGRVGGFVWERLDGATPLAVIAAEVAGRFDVDPGRAERDLLAFVAELVGAGLVQVTGGP